MALGNTKRAMTFIFVTILIDSIGLGIIIPVLPKLIEQLTGEGISEASRYGGWLLFIYAAAQFFCSPVIGNLSDHFGRRPVLLLSLFAMGVDYILMGFAPTIGWLFLGRLISGVAGASYSTANAYIADVTPPERRAQNFGLMGAAFGVGFIIGPVLGGLMADFGPRAPFFTAAGLALLNAAYGYFIIPETLAKENRRPFSWKRANTLGAITHLRRYPVAVGLTGALFLHQLAHFVMPSVWSFYVMEKFAWSVREVGYSLGVAGLSMMIVQGGLIRPAIARIGTERAAYVGLLFAIFSYLGYAFAGSGFALYAFMVPGALAGFAFPSMQGMISSLIPQDAQGELQGALGSVGGMTAIVGPVLMTQLFGFFTSDAAPIHFSGAAFFASAILEFGALILLVRVIRLSAATATA